MTVRFYSASEFVFGVPPTLPPVPDGWTWLCANNEWLRLRSPDRVEHLVTIQDGKVTKLHPLSLATAADVERTEGRLTLGQWYIDTPQAFVPDWPAESRQLKAPDL